MDKPLILTLQLEEKASQFFNDQRKKYFPAHINYLEAHLTLFHALPPEEKIIVDIIQALSKRKIMDMEVTGLHNIGNGVVYTVASAALQSIHASMQQSFQPFLNGKDKQKLWPHITVQNKVTAFKSAELFKKLSQDFIPFSIRATGFSIFVYEGGPWQHLKDFPFEDDSYLGL